MSTDTRTRQSRDKVETKSLHNKEVNNYKETNNIMSATVKPYAERVSNFFDNINGDLKQTWTDAYPNIDIDYQLGKAKAWLLSNTNRAKRDFPKFINNWLAKAMEMPGNQVTKPNTPKLSKYICIQCDNKQESSIDYWKLKCSKCGSEGTMVTPHEYPYMKKSYDEY